MRLNSGQPYHLRRRTAIAGAIFLFLSGPMAALRAEQKYDGSADAGIADTYSEQKYQGGSLGSWQPAGSREAEANNGGFSTGFSDFSLHKLRLILPPFIQVSPESRLNGDFRWGVEGFSQLNITADATLTGIRINHRGLADHPVDIPDLYIRGTIRWNRLDKTVSFRDVTVGRQGVLARVTGQVAYRGPTAVQFNVTLPTTEIQQVLNALPPDLIPKLQGAQVQGSIAVNANFHADPADPQATRLEPGVQVSNYRLLAPPPGANIPALKSDYVHEVKRDGLPVRRILLSGANPRFIPYDQLGETLRRAILKSEDIGFFSHKGFNLGEMRQSVVQNLTSRRFARGGSTITMQLAKNLFLDGRRTLSRKLQEAMLTYALEAEIPKERMFEIYANIIEWGVNVYGASEATEHYFSKTPVSLSPQEASFLASIIPNPRKRDFKTLQQQSPAFASEAASPPTTPPDPPESAPGSITIDSPFY